MDKRQIINFAKRSWMIPFIFVKSAFLSLVQIAWSFVAFGLMGWTIVFIKTNYETVNLPEITSLIGIGVNFIFNNVNLIFWVLLVVYFYFEYMELRNTQKRNKQVRNR
jgi:hypothetical protein